MKKLVVLLLMMLPIAVSGQEETSVGNSFMEESIATMEKIPYGAKAIVLDVLKNGEIDSLGIHYLLPNGDIAEAFFEEKESIGIFWDKIFSYNQVKEIFNIPFGTSYEEAKSILRDKYGDYDYLYSKKNDIVYRDKAYAGVDFDSLHFLFQSDGNKSYFNGAVLCIDCKSRSEAIKKKKWMHDKLSKKYSVFVNMDADGEYLSMGGLPPVADESTFGFGVHIDVKDYEESGRVLGKPFGVRVVYGPYDYVKEDF